MTLLISLLNNASGGSSNDKGYFIDQAALEAAYPVGEAGWYATVGSTDTIWIWDTDSEAWVNSGQSTSGTVTSVSVVDANGISGTVANPNTTPAITLNPYGLVPYNGATQNVDLGDNDLLASSIDISQIDPEENNARLNFSLGDFTMGKIIFQAPDGVDGYTRISMLATDEAGALSTILEATTDAFSYTPIVQSPNFVNQNQITEAVGGQTLLTANSPFYQEFFGDFQIVKLPDATELQSGHAFVFVNNAEDNLDVRTINNSQITNIQRGGRQLCQLSNNSTSSGVWNVITLVPANVSWGSYSLNLPFLEASHLVATDAGKNLVSVPMPTTMIPARETPAGDIDGVNTIFTLSDTPIENSLNVYLNGQLLAEGEGEGYTVDGLTITMTTAPTSGQRLFTTYLKST